MQSFSSQTKAELNANKFKQIKAYILKCLLKINIITQNNKRPSLFASLLLNAIQDDDYYL